MRKKLYWLPLSCALLGACQSTVTDITPENRIDKRLVFSSEARMNTAVAGCYNSLQTGNLLQANALICADAMGEDVVNPTGNWGDIARYSALSSNAQAAGIWQAGYKAIADANRVMEGIQENVDKTTPEQAARWIAETKFVRAVAHFYLVNLFAQSYGFTADASHPGIPIMTKAFYANDPAGNAPRSSVKQVYTQIIADLEDALDTLPANHGTAYQNKTRATKAAAAALLSRVYLYADDYENAKAYAAAVIAKQYGNFGLNAEPTQCFGPGNYLTNESIFSIPSKAGDFEAGFTLTHAFNTGFDVSVSRTFLEAATNPWFLVRDKRRSQLIGTHPAHGTGMSLKYRDVADWAPIIRYSEVLLNYAEAAVKAAGAPPQEALTYLNEVRDRSLERPWLDSYPASLLANETQLLAAILGERRIELAFEGHRIFDLNRNKLKIIGKLDFDNTTYVAAQDYGADKRILPIPLAEMERSGGTLTKNPGY